MDVPSKWKDAQMRSKIEAKVSPEILENSKGTEIKLKSS